MADVNVNVPAEQAPAMAPPIRTDEQILPRIRWVPIGKSNRYLDAERITGGYKCQLDEQWFDLTKDTLRDALQITPVNNNKAFSSPPTPDTLIQFVNDLGYPKEVRHLSDVMTNDMFQPWRALTTIINLCLTGKTYRFERPRAPVFQILWGVINRAHIDYAERMWEEFTQSIHTFTEDKKNLAQQTQGKKKATLIVIPSVRFTSDNISPTTFADLEADTQRAIEEILKEAHGAHRGPLPPMVFRETDPGKLQPLLEVQGKGKEKVGEEQAAQVLLNLHTLKKKSSAEQYIFQRRTSASTEPSVHEDSSSLYAELVSQPQSTPVHAKPNLEHTNVEATDASSQPQPEQMDEGFTATVYPNVQENLKLTADEAVIPEKLPAHRDFVSL
ncbi:hypothetical protein Tco_0543390 [Tanacetum coccineum]